MKRIPFLLILAAGCAVPGPREDLPLFESAEARSARDLLALYFADTSDGYAMSVVVPRGGTAETRAELGKTARQTVVQFHLDFPTRWSKDNIRVEAAQRDAIERFFAGLPAGSTERTLPFPREPKPCPPYGYGPEVERGRADPMRVRILHVSKNGELRTLTIYKAEAQELRTDIPAGEPAVRAIDELFVSLARSGPPK